MTAPTTLNNPSLSSQKNPPPTVNEAFGGNAPESVALVRTPVFGNKPGPKPMAYAEPPPAESNAYLRYSAGIYYTTDMKGCTVEDLTRHPIYGVVPFRTLEGWCGKDKWVERRKAIQEDWRKKIEMAIGSQLARLRLAQLETLQRVYNKALEKLEGDMVAAKTWEGVATVLVRIAEIMDEFRGKVGSEIWANMGVGGTEHLQAGNSMLGRPKLSQEEARAAALTILQHRREETQQKADVETLARVQAKVEILPPEVQATDEED